MGAAVLLQYCDPVKLQWAWMCGDYTFWDTAVRQVVCRQLGKKYDSGVCKYLIVDLVNLYIYWGIFLPECVAQYSVLLYFACMHASAGVDPEVHGAGVIKVSKDSTIM